MLDGFVEWGYFGLFMASFLAATILPFGSEVVFAGLIATGFDIWTSVVIATIGNSMGVNNRLKLNCKFTRARAIIGNRTSLTTRFRAFRAKHHMFFLLLV